MNLAAVTWKDAFKEKGQLSTEELTHEAAIVTTYGIILRNDEKGLSIAGESVDGTSYREITFIPAPLIISIKPLSIRNPRVKRSQGVPKPESTPAEQGGEKSTDQSGSP